MERLRGRSLTPKIGKLPNRRKAITFFFFFFLQEITSHFIYIIQRQTWIVSFFNKIKISVVVRVT